MQSKRKTSNIREKAALETERTILDYLKQQDEPIKFYNLYKNLNFSSGKVQNALKRMQNKKVAFVKKRIKRFENFVWYKEFVVEPTTIALEEENEIIIPIQLNRVIGLILQEASELTTKYNDLTDLLKDALISFFREKVPYSIKNDAINQAIKKGIISEKFGKQILRG